MAYSSLTAIQTVLPGLPQTTTASGYSETSLVVGRHITRADSLINGKISKRYSVPIDPTPPLLANLSEDITAYYTYRSFYSQDNLNRLEYFEDLLKLAMDTLEQIREGDIDLVDTAGSLIEEITEKEGGIVDSNMKDYQPLFDIDDSFDWDFDSELKSEVEDAR